MAAPILMATACSMSERPAAAPDPGPGISLALATARAAAIRNVRYELAFSIPAAETEAVTGRAVIRFELAEGGRPLVLDFTPGAGAVESVAVNGRPSAFRRVPDHIVIPAGEVARGRNSVEVAFRAGDAALNRNPEFLYTLFVPARAHLAFPCFDQPDLKARFALELTVPAGWQAVANGAETDEEGAAAGRRLRFAETQPIPTYLFAFAAGQFQVETAERNGRTLRLFHRETDATKLARNREAIFDLHAAALAWLEDYTAIPYQFGKFDFVAIPSFQFTGMEHPGAIFYNASSMLLEETATENQLLRRAAVIAHETSHMWFGDLVTMRWFDDVWLKEVFANFMAEKIVNPSFPKLDHALRFLVAHYPSAYSVDRTAGTHPIRQPLDNLDDAGTLYGSIIYDKAPIVMRQLERLVGPDGFRDGLRAYLKQFAFGNATWLDLVGVLDARTPLDVAAWSRAWVQEAGRPAVRTEIAGGRIALVQADPRWIQHAEVLVGTAAGESLVPLELDATRNELPAPAELKFVLPAGGGIAYGDFTLDEASRRHLLGHLPELGAPVSRGAAWVTLWEELLDARLAPADFVELALAALPREDTEQNVQLVLGYLQDAYWRFLPEASRRDDAPRLEQALRAGLERAQSRSLKSAYFSALRNCVTTPEGIAYLERVWRREEQIPGLTFAEADEATMALELAVRGVPGAAVILEEQRSRFTNPDQRARFEFVMPALAADPAVRDAWFASLADVKNRRREPWVVDGLRYLHHPLRAVESRRYVRPALDLLAEIQRTGDIFFPTNWLDATLGGHNDAETAAIVRAFLAEGPEYPLRLRRIVLQSADDLFRAARIVAGT